MNTYSTCLLHIVLLPYELLSGFSKRLTGVLHWNRNYKSEMNKNLTWIATCITLQKKTLKKHVLFIMLICYIQCIIIKIYQYRHEWQQQGQWHCITVKILCQLNIFHTSLFSTFYLKIKIISQAWSLID